LTPCIASNHTLNRAGKSTTIGILSGLSSPTSGTALINGRDVTKVRVCVL
jgi:ABC-type multidrug transport system ATPase subunit